ncbi:MAG: cold shock domain-containing protein [Bacteroidetes bacterium]|nr:cold shock domain-containing protein [Bacteroidota bacterium]
MPNGTIKFFNQKRGYGFIKYDDSEQEIFVHATGMIDKKFIQENDKVTFEENQGEKGLSAVNVRKV